MKAAALPLALALLLAPAAALARGKAYRCPEVDVPVVGRSVCSRFGRWDVTPPIFDEAQAITVGPEWHRLLLAPRTFDAQLTVHHVTAKYDLAGTQLGARFADAGTLRLAPEAFRLGPVRFGPAFELGVSALLAAPRFMFRAKTYAPTGAVYSSAGANASAGVPAGPLLLRGELFAGVQNLTISTSEAPPMRRVPRFQTITGGGGPPEDGLVISDGRFRLAPRVSAEVWLGDYWTVGLGGGMDVIHRDDFSLGAFFRSYFDKKGMHDPRGR